MKVYIESNFVLETVFEQEENKACRSLLQLAASRQIELAIPAFALLEPYERIARHEKRSRETAKSLEVEARELNRSEPFMDDADFLEEASNRIEIARTLAWEGFEVVRDRLLKICRVLPVDGQVIRAAKHHIDDHQLELPDAVMLATVLADSAAHSSPSLFLNRNARDFDSHKVRTALQAQRCEVITSFSTGLLRLKHKHGIEPKAKPRPQA